MAVLTCKRRDDLSGKKDENSKGYKETFIVTVEAGDEPAVILNSNLSSIPQIGDPHPVDTTATVRNLNVKHTKNRRERTSPRIGFRVEAHEAPRLAPHI